MATIEISEYVIDAIANAVVKKMQEPCEDASEQVVKERTETHECVSLCDDVISRQAIIDMTGLSNWFDSSDSYNEFVIALSELPSVTPQARWIPVSERLPKAGEYVGNVDKYYLVQNEYWEQIFQVKPIADEIVAWMPLPEPYKAESEG